MFFIWLALLAAVILPVCAVLGGIVTWLATRNNDPADGTLLGFFLGATLMFAGASTTLLKSEWFRERFDPRVKMERAVLADPVNAALKDSKPFEWQKFEPLIQQAAVDGTPQQQVLARTREQHLALVRRMLPFAPGCAKLRYGEAVVPAMAELRTRDSSLCVRLAWHLAGPPFDAAARLSPPVAQAWEAAAAEVVRTAEFDTGKRLAWDRKAPANQPLELRDMQLAYTAIRAELEPRYGDAIGKLHTAQVTQVEPGLACDASIALFQAALKQEPRVARDLLGNMLRD